MATVCLQCGEPGERHSECDITLLCEADMEAFERLRQNDPYGQHPRRQKTPLDPVGLATLAPWFSARIADNSSGTLGRC